MGLLRQAGGENASAAVTAASAALAPAPHATTVVALRYADGVIMAGDRRATMGNIIAHRAMEKVFEADRFSAVAIAGSAGMAVEMVRLFQVQLEHYEKVEGTTLSLEGKANQLAQMVRQNLPLAMQGLVVVPLFAGYDTARGIGRIFSYDATGGHYEDTDFQATGSGGRDARSTIKLGYREGMSPGRCGRPGHPIPLRCGGRGLGHRWARSGAGHLPARRRGGRRGLPPGARGRGGRALRRPRSPAIQAEGRRA